MKFGKLRYTIFILFVVNIAYAQQIIDSTTNYIQYKNTLEPFYHKLENKARVNILHIGDSHIQANFLTGELRRLFQEKYGNAGRGMVFPLRLAKTNGHLDIRFSSNINWDYSKLTDLKKVTSGISGVSISTTKKTFYLKLRNKDNLEISRIKITGKGLDKFTFGTTSKNLSLTKEPSQNSAYKVKKGDNLWGISRKFKISVKNLKRWNNLRNNNLKINQKLNIKKSSSNYIVKKLNLNDFYIITPSISGSEEIILDIPKNFENLYFICNENQQKELIKLDEIFIENNNKGIVYNSVGMNGAKFKDYNKSNLFFEQLPNLNPDLIIVSLGTNESFYNTIDERIFEQDVRLFFEQLTDKLECRQILITTPPSSLKKRKYTNPKLRIFSEVLIKIASEKNYAIWNLFQVMGNENGMEDWYKNGLAGKDRIHFTDKGYKLQANHLFDSFFYDEKIAKEQVEK